MCGAGALARESELKIKSRGRGRPRHTAHYFTVMVRTCAPETT